MTNWTDMPLAAFDLETTGPDPTTARIVTACLIRIDGSDVAPQNWIVDPEIEIPDGAAAVHGVTTDRARAEGAPYGDGYEQIRTELERVWLEGRVVAIYNASFDLTLMDREGRRLGYPPLDYGPVIDPYVIDRAVDKYRKGKRTLGVTCEHYGITLENAHAADADALAAARLAWVLGNRTPGLAVTAADLMVRQAEWHRDRQLDYAAYLAHQGEDASDVCADWPLRGVA